MKSPHPLSLVFSVQALRERLAENIRVLDVSDVSTIADYFVIATGNATPHLRALADEVDICCKKEKKAKLLRRGGTPESGWVVLDFGNVVVHLMTPQLREFYTLEQLWSDAKTVEV
jgi:ribosome-associated protein